MRYHSYLEAEPTLDSYRLSHAPRADYSPVFICPFVVLTSESGKTYNLMRGIQGQRKDETMNFGIYEVSRSSTASARCTSRSRTCRSPSRTGSPRPPMP